MVTCHNDACVCEGRLNQTRTRGPEIKGRSLMEPVAPTATSWTAGDEGYAFNIKAPGHLRQNGAYRLLTQDPVPSTSVCGTLMAWRSSWRTAG
jgi:hypothetical protein